MDFYFYSPHFFLPISPLILKTDESLLDLRKYLTFDTGRTFLHKKTGFNHFEYSIVAVLRQNPTINCSTTDQLC